MFGQREFLIACLVAAAATFGTRFENASTNTDSFPGWPATFEGRALERIELEARERQFYEDFPGEIARFSDGEREIILRWVAEETHFMHPAATCFRGRGFVIEPLKGILDSEGRRWGTFRATREDGAFEVRELVYNDTECWSDVSAWYWSATLARTEGPWWAVMVAE